MNPDTERHAREPAAASAQAADTPASAKLVKQFRQHLVWPLQLMPAAEGTQIHKHWEALAAPGPANPWSEVADEITGDSKHFAERHYREFVAFLPYVQRFLYGEREGGGPRGYGDSPMRVFRRRDVAGVRVKFAGHDPIVFAVVHIDLYFFYDMDVVILACELAAENLDLDLVHEALYRLGRAYPGGWTEDGEGLHCPEQVEFLSAAGAVLVGSDYRNRDKFLAAVCEHRAPRLSAHWEFLLKPLVQDASDEAGPLRYRLLEYYKMPVMAYLAMDDMRGLARGDYVRLALITGRGAPATLPFATPFLADFEQRYCYDRYFEEARPGSWANVRFLSSGYAFIMVGDARAPVFVDHERGLLAQFRHEYFLVFLIAHLHKAALLMLSHRAVAAVGRLNIESDDSVRRFRRETRQSKEIFLRFTHRYWFHEVSDKVQTRELFQKIEDHLGTERLYAEVRDELQDMSDYLDSDALRRQSNTMIRLTVVTILGLILAAVTGFLGMNIISEAEAGHVLKIVYFLATLLAFVAVVAYTLLISRRLSEFLDVLTDDRLPGRRKWQAFLRVWRRRPSD
ncbi:MAG TPA: CorA family divalent cation transporter [Alphaproteobacteria bacterium]